MSDQTKNLCVIDYSFFAKTVQNSGKLETYLRKNDLYHDNSELVVQNSSVSKFLSQEQPRKNYWKARKKTDFQKKFDFSRGSIQVKFSGEKVYLCKFCTDFEQKIFKL